MLVVQETEWTFLLQPQIQIKKKEMKKNLILTALVVSLVGFFTLIYVNNTQTVTRLAIPTNNTDIVSDPTPEIAPIIVPSPATASLPAPVSTSTTVKRQVAAPIATTTTVAAPVQQIVSDPIVEASTTTTTVQQTMPAVDIVWANLPIDIKNLLVDGCPTSLGFTKLSCPNLGYHVTQLSDSQMYIIDVASHVNSVQVCKAFTGLLASDDRVQIFAPMLITPNEGAGWVFDTSSPNCLASTLSSW